ncbi:uncharacterized protein LOC124237673 isoform X1 [Equus quagga]|uniref:uncharacterized protein LOC124237673 isoform X1 n=1 Tax=Equus quagga TaxID=89248 RepID=UPI001EE184B8|nr:uncharacterized protein LOC124237673 isoform X1 [Equus quagga]
MDFLPQEKLIFLCGFNHFCFAASPRQSEKFHFLISLCVCGVIRRVLDLKSELPASCQVAKDPGKGTRLESATQQSVYSALNKGNCVPGGSSEGVGGPLVKKGSGWSQALGHCPCGKSELDGAEPHHHGLTQSSEMKGDGSLNSSSAVRPWQCAMEEKAPEGLATRSLPCPGHVSGHGWFLWSLHGNSVRPSAGNGASYPECLYVKVLSSLEKRHCNSKLFLLLSICVSFIFVAPTVP